MLNDPKPQENQQELFAGFSPETKHPERMPSIAKTQKPILISTTLEQVLLVAILTILLLSFVFFLGVLRGQAIAGSPQFSVVQQAAVSKRPLVSPVGASKPAAVRPAAQSASAAALLDAQPKKTPSVINGKDLLKPYTIQVLTTKKKEYAENEVVLLKKSGFYGLIIPSGEYYQVCAGLYSNKEEAKRDLSFFSSKYKSCYLRRR